MFKLYGQGANGSQENFPGNRPNDGATGNRPNNTPGGGTSFGQTNEESLATSTSADQGGSSSMSDDQVIINELNSLPATAAGQPVEIDGQYFILDPQTGELVPFDAELPVEEEQPPVTPEESADENPQAAAEALVDSSDVATALMALGSWKVLANATTAPNQGERTGRMTKQQRISAKVNNWLAMQKVDCEALDQDAQKRSFIRWEDGQLVSNDALKKKIG